MVQGHLAAQTKVTQISVAMYFCLDSGQSSKEGSSSGWWGVKPLCEVLLLPTHLLLRKRERRA